MAGKSDAPTVIPVFRTLAKALEQRPDLAAIALVSIACAWFIRKKITNWGVVVIAVSAMVAIVYISTRPVGTGKPSIWSQLADDQRKDMLNCLRGAASEISEDLHLPPRDVRANLFELMSSDKDRLKILPDMTVNMGNRPQELTVSMPVGQGSSGRAYSLKAPNIATFSDGWGESAIADGEELRKVDRDLRWIISVPVFGEDRSAAPLMIMNVDGLHAARTESQLRQALTHLYNYSEQISEIIKPEQGRLSRVPASTENEVALKDAVASPGIKHYSVTSISRADIAPASPAFLRTTRTLTTVRPIDSPARHAFHERVEARFASTPRSHQIDP